MKDFLKYLFKTPSRLLFLLGVFIFTLGLGIVVFIMREEFILENSVSFFVFTELFLLTILLISSNQVYTEWKNGRK